MNQQVNVTTNINIGTHDIVNVFILDAKEKHEAEHNRLLKVRSELFTKEFKRIQQLCVEHHEKMLRVDQKYREMYNFCLKTNALFHNNKQVTYSLTEKLALASFRNKDTEHPFSLMFYDKKHDNRWNDQIAATSIGFSNVFGLSFNCFEKEITLDLVSFHYRTEQVAIENSFEMVEPLVITIDEEYKKANDDWQSHSIWDEEYEQNLRNKYQAKLTLQALHNNPELAARLSEVFSLPTMLPPTE